MPLLLAVNNIYTSHVVEVLRLLPKQTHLVYSLYKETSSNTFCMSVKAFENKFTSPYMPAIPYSLTMKSDNLLYSKKHSNILSPHFFGQAYLIYFLYLSHFVIKRFRFYFKNLNDNIEFISNINNNINNILNR